MVKFGLLKHTSRSQRERHSTAVDQGRFPLIFLIFLFLFLAVIVRLFYWQVIKAKELSQLAKKQYQRQLIQTGQRGNIYTADGYILATNTPAFRLFAQPKLIPAAQKKPLAEKLAKILFAFDNKDNPTPKTDTEKKATIEALKKKLLTKLEQPKSWISLYLNLNEATKEKISQLHVKQLGFDQYSKRIYPEASMAAQIVGFVGKNKAGEDTGYFGIEGGMNKELAGRKMKKTFLTDALGLIISSSGLNQPSLDGRDVILTIRRDLQHIAEVHLAAGIKKYGAERGEIVIADPQTGAILADAVWPSFDPNKFWQFPSSSYRNPSLVDSYEPGSTFKTLTVASGLDAQVIQPNTPCTRCSGPRKIDKYTIRTWNDQYHPQISVTQALAKSDNIAMIFIAEKLGTQRLKAYLHRFAIGQALNIDLQGDHSTPFPKRWGHVELATISFGQGIVTTSLQLVRAVASLANHGVLMQPLIVSQVKDKTSGETITIRPKKIRQVVQPETAAKMVKMMIESAMHGEAQWTASKDHWVAGKTGTSQVAQGGKYANDQTIATFIAFAPPDKPQFIMLVKLVAPRSSPWAAETAAPLWFQTAKDVYLALGIPPDREN